MTPVMSKSVAIAREGAAVLKSIMNTAARTKNTCFDLLNVSSKMMCLGHAEWGVLESWWQENLVKIRRR